MRRSIRLPGFDCTGSATYLITLVTQSRAPILGQIVKGQVLRSAAGDVVAEEWVRSGTLRREVQLDVFVVMPDHFHAIVTFRPDAGNLSPMPNGVGAHGCAPLPSSAPLPIRNSPNSPPHRSPRSLGSLISSFKATTTARINRTYQTAGLGDMIDSRACRRIWQRNYHESILWDDEALERARWYVEHNPVRWRQTG